MLLLGVSQDHQSIGWYLLAVSSTELEVLDFNEPGTNSITLSSRIHIPILKSVKDCRGGGALSLAKIDSPDEKQTSSSCESWKGCENHQLMNLAMVDLSRWRWRW